MTDRCRYCKRPVHRGAGFWHLGCFEANRTDDEA